MIGRLRDNGFDGVPRLLRRARHEQRVSVRDDALSDRGDLRGRFAKPENNFRKALPMVPMGIHAGEAKVLERRRCQCVANAGSGGTGIECPGAYLVEHLS